MPLQPRILSDLSQEYNRFQIHIMLLVCVLHMTCPEALDWPIFFSCSCRVRLHGSYGTLDAGKCFEATEDLTGGVTERFLLRDDDLPADLFSIMVRASQRGSLLTCCVPSAKKVKVTIGSARKTSRAILHPLKILRRRCIGTIYPGIQGRLWQAIQYTLFFLLFPVNIPIYHSGRRFLWLASCSFY